MAREHGIPTTIARLNVPYGNNGGWPWMHMEQVLAGQPIGVHVDAPSTYNLLHEDDIIASVPALLGSASVPATIVNWGGDEHVSVQEWVRLANEWTGKQASVQVMPAPGAPIANASDPTLRRSITGPCARDFRKEYRKLFDQMTATTN